TTKPNAINARLVRVHASRVRSAAKNTRGSFRSDMGQLPDSPEHATRIATACLRTGWTGAESPGRLVIIDNLYYRTTLPRRNAHHASTLLPSPGRRHHRQRRPVARSPARPDAPTMAELVRQPDRAATGHALSTRRRRHPGLAARQPGHSALFRRQPLVQRRGADRQYPDLAEIG